MVKITTNFPEYQSTLRLYAKARKKPHAEVVTRFLSQANFAMVRSEATGGVARMKFGKLSKFKPLPPKGPKVLGSRGGKRAWSRAMFHAFATGLRRGPDNQWTRQTGVNKGKGNYDEALRIYKDKRRRKGAFAAGFLVSARKLGLKQKGGKTVQPVAGGSALKSSGRKARPVRKILATSINAVDGSYDVARATMDRAINFVIRDARDHALRLLQKTNDKFQPGRKPR